MQPGLRLVLESYEWGPNSVGPLLEKWAGRYLETDHTEGMWRYSVTSKHPKDERIVQHTMIQVQNTPIGGTNGLTTVLIEVGLMLEEEEDPDLAAPGLPPFHRLLPQRFIWDIVSMGGWTRKGIPLHEGSKKVEFDDVEEWWEDICNEAEQVPQVIVGSALAGDLPVVSPDTVSTILSGFAKVYHASSIATMEKMNEVMGKMKAPKGSVRILLSNPSSNPKQPLYIGERLRGPVVIIEGEQVQRPFEVDVFLRLAKRSLVDDVVPEYWEDIVLMPVETAAESFLKQREKERLGTIRTIEDMSLRIEELEKALEVTEDAFQSASIENERFKEEISKIQAERDDFVDEISILKEVNETQEDLERDYKDALTKKKKEIKSLKKQMRDAEAHMKDIAPLLKKYTEAENLEDIGELIESLKSKLFAEDEEVLEDESAGFDSVVSVLRHVRESMGEMFVISKSAITSAEESVFRWPRRVMEAFEVMVQSYEYVLNRAKSNQSLDYAKVFRGHGETAFEVANSETAATMKRHPGSRDFIVEGRKFQMQPHIKIGKSFSPDKCLRIHFLFDRDKEKFLIGHCGHHLPIVK